jgi:hypothetical protein
MSTLVIELPETIASEVRSSGIPKQQLDAVVLSFVQKYVQAYPQVDLEHLLDTNGVALQQMAYAPTDPLFMADLQETMTVFAAVDAEWWEPIV